MGKYLSTLEFGQIQEFGEMSVIPLFKKENHALNYLTLQEALDNGQIQEFGEMSIIPLFKKENHALNYLTLQEALDKDLLIITEKDHGGSVPELKVVNKAEIPVLLLDGEEIIGAKQNRIINTTILLKEQSETIIPVSCTESGRWSYTSAEFADSDTVASSKIRKKKSASVRESLKTFGEFRSEQGAIWEGIEEMHCYAATTETESPTRAMKNIYESKDKNLEEYLEAFKPLDGQKGIFVFINGDITGFDIFSLESTYKKFHKKLIKSYSIDAILQENYKDVIAKNRVERARNFIKNITECEESVHKSVGYGWDCRYKSKSLIGSSLLYQDQIIHATFFENENISKEEIV
ncbi:MAG: DUF6569 family protein [Methanobacterium sp.]|jgi:ribosomal protein L20A (L18A)